MTKSFLPGTNLEKLGELKNATDAIKHFFPDAEIEAGNPLADITRGFQINATVISRSGLGKREIMIEVYPFAKWSDGTYRPVYFGGWKAVEDNAIAFAPLPEGCHTAELVI